MKGKLALSILLVAVLALFGTGCGGDKVTGGGRFTDELSGHKITFGFNAQPLDEESEVPGMVKAKGRFLLVDHDTKMKIHGTFTGTYMTPSEGASWFSGRCSIDGEGDTYFEVLAADVGKSGLGAGDGIYIMIGEYGSPNTIYQGYLEGGSIQVHKTKKVKK